MSPLELRQLVESGFLPLRCVCNIDPEQKMTVSVYPPGKGHPAFMVHDLDATELTSNRAIVDLVLRLKQELASQHQGTLEAWRRQG